MARQERYEWDDLAIFMTKAGRLLGKRYERWGVDTLDIFQQLNLRVLAKRENYERWLAADPQQTTRIFRDMYDHGKDYAEKEKAERLGYETSDITWYSPSMVEAVLPLALDPGWNGMVAVSGEDQFGAPAKQNEELMVVVFDVRRAISETRTLETLFNGNPGDDDYEAAIQQVVDALGGNRHYVGKRKATSNSKAQHLTEAE